jgi:hypothetical protein
LPGSSAKTKPPQGKEFYAMFTTPNAISTEVSGIRSLNEIINATMVESMGWLAEK